MKKIIDNYEALLISLASKGDSTAFHSLITPYLKSHYAKLIEDGIEHTEANTNLCKTGADLFKKFIGSNPGSFDQWIKENGEKSDTSEENFLPSLKTEQNDLSNQLHLHLQRTAYTLHQNNRTKSKLAQLFSKKTYSIFFIGSGIIILVATLIGVLLISHYSISFKLTNPENKSISFSFPEVKNEEPIVIENKQIAIKDTPVPAKIDTPIVDTLKKTRSASKKSSISYPKENLKSSISEYNAPPEISTSSATAEPQPSTTSRESDNSNIIQPSIPATGDSIGKSY